MILYLNVLKYLVTMCCVLNVGVVPNDYSYLTDTRLSEIILHDRLQSRFQQRH